MTNPLYGHALEAQLRIQDDGHKAKIRAMSQSEFGIVSGCQSMYTPTLDPKVVIPGTLLGMFFTDGQEIRLPLLWLPASHAAVTRNLARIQSDLRRRRLRWGTEHDLTQMILQ